LHLEEKKSLLLLPKIPENNSKNVTNFVQKNHEGGQPPPLSMRMSGIYYVFPLAWPEQNQ
jgi:hypothetical protein